MKKYIQFTVGALIACGFPGIRSAAQTLSLEKQYLDINKIKAVHMVHGDMWYDPVTFKSGVEFPAGSGKTGSYSGGLWAVGRDANDTLYAAATLYRTTGVDFYPGPLNDTGFCPASVSADWAKIWKVSAADIIAFKALSTRTAATIPADIYTWPAKGNIYAQGAGGAALNILTDMAPFVDVNGDGIYNAPDGDYPKIKGDQMLWWVINDNTYRHMTSKGNPMKIEYRISAYAYNRGTDIDRVLYYEYEMQNKSGIKYKDFQFALFSDADLGCPYDDYIAFDSTHRMGIEYNGEIPDCADPASYGNYPPIAGYTLVETPGDVYPSAMLPAGAFNTFENTLTGTLRDPRTASEFEAYMKGNDADGNPLAGGPYLYSTKNGEVMCDMKMLLKDRRFVVSTGTYGFQPNTKAKVAMAVLFTDTLGYTCGSMAGFKPITDLADTVWKVYWNPLKPLSATELAMQDTRLRIYPNPAGTTLMLSGFTGKRMEAGNVQVFDMLGRRMEVPVLQQPDGLQLSVSQLAPGTYHIIYEDGERHAGGSFVKQ